MAVATLFSGDAFARTSSVASAATAEGMTRNALAVAEDEIAGPL
jgi:hypothetical protein